MLGERLAAARKAARLTQNDVADQLGIRRQTYSAYERGVSTPDAHTVGILAKMFGVSADALITEPSVKKHGTEYCTVPVYGRLFPSAPYGTEAELLDYEEVDASLCEGATLSALVIRGGEMEPRMAEGDVVIFRRQAEIPTGSLAVVSVGGGEATVRRLIRYTDGIRLVPLNPAYEPLYYTSEEIRTLPLTFYGKVVELRAKLG
ncbi:MAG: helix-turn-helix domain-containing protein [Clostridia bacterium]|nr:helix-turn-helix domain-containing protein [Clostridia bacterium]